MTDYTKIENMATESVRQKIHCLTLLAPKRAIKHIEKNSRLYKISKMNWFDKITKSELTKLKRFCLDEAASDFVYSISNEDTVNGDVKIANKHIMRLDKFLNELSLKYENNLN